jgi:hypothetical protein
VYKPVGLFGILLTVVTLGAIPASAATVDEPWSIGLAVGYFMPATEDWEENYDRRGGWMPSLSAGYAVTARLSVAAEIAYFRAEGQARGAITGEPSPIEEQQLTLIPSTVGLEYRFRYESTQLFVPFAGVGYRRVTYRSKVGDHETVSGGANGVVGRGGVDILLNGLDPSSASGLREDYGVARSYFRLEAQWAQVEAPGTGGSDVDLGGVTYLAGMRFEF